MHTQRKNVVTNKTWPNTHGIDEKAKTLTILLLQSLTFGAAFFWYLGMVFSWWWCNIQGLLQRNLVYWGGVLGIRDWCLVGADAIGEDYSKGIWHFGVFIWFLGACIQYKVVTYEGITVMVFGIFVCVFGIWGHVLSWWWCNMRGLL